MIIVSDTNSKCVESIKMAQAAAREATVALDELDAFIFSQSETGAGAKLTREFIEMRSAVGAILMINAESVENVPRALELAYSTCDSSLHAIVKSFDELSAIKRHPSSIGQRHMLIDATSRLANALGSVMEQAQFSRNIMLEELNDRRVDA